MHGVVQVLPTRSRRQESQKIFESSRFLFRNDRNFISNSQCYSLQCSNRCRGIKTNEIPVALVSFDGIWLQHHVEHIWAELHLIVVYWYCEWFSCVIWTGSRSVPLTMHLVQISTISIAYIARYTTNSTISTINSKVGEEHCVSFSFVSQ